MSIKKLQSLFSKRIKSVQQTPLSGISSISNRIALGKNGIYRLRIRFQDGSTLDCVRKTKSKSIVRNGVALISGRSARFKLSMTLHTKILGYNKSCTREITLYNRLDPSLGKHMLQFYGSYYERGKGIYSLIFRRCPYRQKERLTFEEARQALDVLLDFQIFYCNREDLAKSLGLNRYTPADYRRAKGFIRLLFHAEEAENRRCFSAQKLQKIDRFIDCIDKQAAQFAHHRSFSHNDFTRRNLFFTEQGVLLYDFELAAFQNPEHDLIELLVYEAEHLSESEILALIDYHRTRLSPHSLPLRSMSRAEYKELLLFNAYEFIAIRLSLLRIAGKALGESFVGTLADGADKLTNTIEENYG